LPLPKGPTINHLAGLDRQVNAAQRRVLELPGAVDLLDLTQFDKRQLRVDHTAAGRLRPIPFCRAI
jgi:hypothetical protein